MSFATVLETAINRVGFEPCTRALDPCHNNAWS
jgi:hypothetical protein